MNAGALPSIACAGRLPEGVGLLVLLPGTHAQRLLLFITKAMGSPKLIKERLPFLCIYYSYNVCSCEEHWLDRGRPARRPVCLYPQALSARASTVANGRPITITWLRDGP